MISLKERVTRLESICRRFVERVQFIDMDKQANASYWFDKNPAAGTLAKILVRGIQKKAAAAKLLEYEIQKQAEGKYLLIS